LIVEVHRKRIKNLYLRLAGSEARVIISAPSHLDDNAITAVVFRRLAWIERRRRCLADLKTPAELHYLSGEQHYFQGKKLLLEVVEKTGKPEVRLVGDQIIRMQVQPGQNREIRADLLYLWYRMVLALAIPPLLEHWQEKLGVRVNGWRIRRMKSRWGSCQIKSARICLNLELIKRSPLCLEYVLVHELAHLLERRHNARFRSIMEQAMPEWRKIRRELNQAAPPYL